MHVLCIPIFIFKVLKQCFFYVCYADHYETGQDPGDAGVLYSGYSSSNIRWGSEPPKPDTAGEFHNNSYGSAHARGFNMAFGDGRIETFGFDIDPAVHRALAGRANGSLPVID